MMKYFILLILLHLSLFCFSQTIKGKIVNKDGTSISDASIKWNNNKGCNSTRRGNFKVKLSEGENSLTFQHINYKTKTITLFLSKNETKNIEIILEEDINMLSDIEIIKDKNDKIITDVLTIKKIKSEAFQKEVNNDLSDILQRFSGITLSDNQISIRGGSGWNAMAGSRVLVLIDDIPLLSGNMGQIPWDLIPIENIEEIKVLKGAASAIYGSSAMNGVINVKTKSANKTQINNNKFPGYTQINSSIGMYDSPKNKNHKWWNGNRYFCKIDALHSEILGNTSLTLGFNHFTDEGYRYLEENNRNQFSLNLFHNPKNIDRLIFGVNGTFMKQEVGNFLLWESYENAYIPIDSNLYNSNSTLFHLDPFVSFKTNNGKHSVKSRVMKIQLDNNTNGVDTGKDMFSETYYMDYKYKGWLNFLSSDLIIGATTSNVFAKAEVFNGKNSSSTNSVYLFIEKEKDATTFSLGGRYEIVNIKSEDVFRFNDGEEKNDYSISYPLFYTGLKHKIDVNKNLRAYIGQGIRFPSIAELASSTNVHGGTYIYPNLSLKPEYGWSFESAYHQKEQIGKMEVDFDIAYFLMQYNNMMEFSFAQWGTEYDLAHAYGLGFKTINIGKTKIDGFETEMSSKYKFNNKIILDFSIGYTYMRPISLTPDSVYAQTNHYGVTQDITFNNSSSDTSILKYRYTHLLKLDANLNIGKLSISGRLNYNDYMKNIDYIFTSELVNDGVSDIGYPAIIPGINDSRENNKNGDFMVDLNFAYQINKVIKMNFIINNILNSEIQTRPTNLIAPRRYSVKLKFTI